MTATSKTRIEQALLYVDPQVWVVTARSGEATGGLIATFVTKASIVPDCPRFILGMAKHHHTWQLIEQSEQCVLHLIGLQHLDWVLQLGITSGHQPGSQKLTGFVTETLVTGTPVLQGALAAFDCQVEAKLDTGDRTVFLLEVKDASSSSESSSPLRFGELWQALSPEQRTQLSELFRQDQQIDRQAILNWRANLLESQT